MYHIGDMVKINLKGNKDSYNNKAWEMQGQIGTIKRVPDHEPYSTQSCYQITLSNGEDGWFNWKPCELDLINSPCNECKAYNTCSDKNPFKCKEGVKNAV